MAMVNVTKKLPKLKKEATIPYDFGNDCDDAIAKFGKVAVFSNFVANSTVGLQAAMSSRMVRGLEVNSLTTVWKPGVKMQRLAVDPKAAAIAAFATMSAEDKKKFLADLKAAG